ncbi:MAG: FAD-binding oxidoreductase [Deltaproteobacteria bacterium]|jgi:glycine/D-amino acid oxidase-like deaminating enzyme|nr:FAD-binding oxidoreductase [Deltaproteobacteria bacterium]
MRNKEDVIIIGGGVIGTACAYFLSRRGVKVLLLERNNLGCGASGTTAAIISISGTSGTPEALRRFNIESADLILSIEKDFDRSIEIIREGTLYVAMNEHEADDLKPAFNEVRDMGIEAQWLVGEAIHRFEPLLGTDAHTAFYHPTCYHVNPFRLYEGYLGAALRRGSRIEYGVEAHEVKLNHNRVERVITNKGEYQADYVVVAGGAWTPEILSTLEIEIPIVPARGQVILTEACSQRTQCLLSFADHLYIKQTASGNFYLGSHTEFVGFENRITLEKISNFARAFIRAVPLLARLRALRFFAGFRPITEDELPIIGPVPACSKLIIASGHGRTGVRYSAATGKAVSELIVDGKTEHPIDAFAVDRFAGKTQTD